MRFLRHDKPLDHDIDGLSRIRRHRGDLLGNLLLQLPANREHRRPIPDG